LPGEGDGGVVADIVEGQVALSMADFRFSQNEIRVKRGEALTLLVTNDQGVHDIVIDELGVNSSLIPVGQTVEVVVPTDVAGAFEFYCSVGSHRQLGMVGRLIIEE
jgi:plastocyanin